MKAIPSSECIKSNNSASFIAGEPFVTSPHRKIKCASASWDCLFFERFKIKHYEGRIRFDDNRGHFGLLLLLQYSRCNHIKNIGYNLGVKF